MRILVTGSQGFTGKHLVALAEKQGNEVYSLRSDLRNRNELALEIDKFQPTHVVHLAAISAVTHENSMELFDVNLSGVMNLLDSLRPVKALQKILLASSANIYGNNDVSPIKETSIPNPQNLYAYSKFAMECLAKSYLNQLPLFLVRPFNYTGPGHDERFVIPKIIKAFHEKKEMIELGNIDVEREFNDVRMVCDTYLKLLKEAKTGETYNICSGRAISVGRILEEISELTNHTLEVKINPRFIRPNEIFSLYGDKSKLEQTIGPILNFSVTQTLESMLLRTK
jgi:nucleoside-diphosphate-sugar epimerase